MKARTLTFASLSLVYSGIAMAQHQLVLFDTGSTQPAKVHAIQHSTPNTPVTTPIIVHPVNHTQSQVIPAHPTAAAVASAVPQGTAELLDGPYVGIDAGISTLRVSRVNHPSDREGVSSTSMVSLDPGVQLNLGYGKHFGKAYLGGVLSANYNTGQTTVRNAKYENQWDVSLSLRPGYDLNRRAMFYTSIGLGFGHLTSSPASTTVLYGPSRFSVNKLATVLGFGMVDQLTSNVSLNMGYQHWRYAQFSNQNAYVGNYGADINQYGITRETFLVGASYQFASMPGNDFTSVVSVPTWQHYVGVSFNRLFGQDRNREANGSGVNQADIRGNGGSLFAGAAYNVHRFHLAAELHGGIYLARARQINDHYNYNLTRQYGIDLQPGYYVSQGNLVYLLGGVEFGTFKSDFFDTGAGMGGSTTKIGYRFGAGLQSNFTSNLAARFQYSYNRYDMNGYRYWNPIAYRDRLAFSEVQAGIVFNF